MANGSCQCKAFVNGHKECKRRAAARLVELYETAPAQASVPTRRAAALRQPRIVRSVERDRFGRRHVVVRCDGWAI
jgi:hypothetical protein